MQFIECKQMVSTEWTIPRHKGLHLLVDGTWLPDGRCAIVYRDYDRKSILYYHFGADENEYGDFIRQKYLIVINRVKDLLAGTDKTVSEIAYEVGFQYPHHLSRMFRKIAGCTPNEYRSAI